MDKLFGSNISIEKFAAFLDGNLSDEEMKEISSVISNDQNLSALSKASEEIDFEFDKWLTGWSNKDFSLPEELQNQDFVIPEIDNFQDEGDIFEDNSHLYHQETLQNIENMNEEYDSLSNHSIFGEEGSNEKSAYVQQYYNDTCAIRSQQIIMRDYGVDISEHDLRDIAIDNAWYTPGEGTSMQDIGNLMQIAGIDCHQSMNNTVYDLVSELSQGHRVIVGVDSGELWAKTSFARFGEKVEDFFGIKGADHALIVAGIDVNPNDPKDVKVILTDPGSGDLRIEYKMEDFLDAWKDSNCFMVSTEQPAPYQFDPITNSEVPSGFHSDYSFNSFIVDNGYQLSPNDMTIPEDYLATYSEEQHINWQNYLDNDLSDFANNGFDSLEDIDLNT